MQKPLRRAYHILYNQLERLKNLTVTADTLYFMDKTTGEFIPVAKLVGEDADRIAKKIRNGKRDGLTFISMHQDPINDILKNLTGSSVKILLYIASRTKFENFAFDISYRKMAEALGMSVKTVTFSMKELKAFGVIATSGKRGKLIYHVNPGIFWKGHISLCKSRLVDFEERMGVKTKEEEL